jgi:Tol biopolymer transport system component
MARHNKPKLNFLQRRFAMTNDVLENTKMETPLESWKEIAAFLQRDVRTVIRWEKSEGLPVHRHHHLSRSSVYAYASELEAWRAGRGPAQSTTGWWRPVPAFTSAIVIALSLMMAGSGPHIGSLVQAADSSGITLRRIWEGPDVDTLGKPSPDGKFLSYVDWDTGNLALLDVATGEKRPLTKEGSWSEPGEFAENSVWSQDGSQLAYTWYANGEQIRIISLEGSVPRVVFQDKESNAVAVGWFPDGNDLLAWLCKTQRGSRFYEIARISISDGRAHVLKKFDLPDIVPGNVSLSSGGKYVAYDYPQQGDSPQRDIFILNADGSREATLIAHPADDRFLGWTPDGGGLLFCSDRTGDVDAWIARFAGGRLTGAPKLLKKNIGRIAPIGFAKNGSYFYGQHISAHDAYVATLDPASGRLVGPPERATERWPGGTVGPEWSPDGRFLAYATHRAPLHMRSENKIFIRTLSTKAERQLPMSLNHVRYHRWSPDGRSLLVCETSEDHRESGFLVNVQSGKTIPLFTLGKDEHNLQAVWSPDGNAVFYSLRKHPEREKWSARIVRRELGTERETTLYSIQDFANPICLAVSPDGKQLAFTLTHVKNQPHRLMLVPASGGETHEMVRFEKGTLIAPDALAWTLDGKYLLFVKAGQGLEGKELYRVPAIGGEPERITHIPVKRLLGLRLHPDGRQIAFTVVGSQGEVWVMENFLPPSEAAAKK